MCPITHANLRTFIAPRAIAFLPVIGAIANEKRDGRCIFFMTLSFRHLSSIGARGDIGWYKLPALCIPEKDSHRETWTLNTSLPISFSKRKELAKHLHFFSGGIFFFQFSPWLDHSERGILTEKILFNSFFYRPHQQNLRLDFTVSQIGYRGKEG